MPHPRRPAPASNDNASLRLFDAEGRALADKIVRFFFAVPWTDDHRAAAHVLRRAAGTPAVPRIEPLARTLIDRALARLAAGVRPTGDDVLLYQELCFAYLDDAHRDRFQQILDGRSAYVAYGPLFRVFAAEHARILGPGAVAEDAPSAEHLFAMSDQLRRATHYVESTLIGTSALAESLRAAVMCSIFTDDLRAWVGGLYDRLHAIPTLITGPTGTGKELIAQALAYARFIPWGRDAMAFVAQHGAGFHPLHLAGLAPTLVESEIFGHERGAFTGAVKQHRGALEECGRLGTLFLDEIGEIDLVIQVKLLRVLQGRVFSRVGGRKPLAFEGHIVAATHRDLEQMIEDGDFRDDLYYRLAADELTTPSLRAQLDEAPADLGLLARHIAGQIVGDDRGEALAERTVQWIGKNLPPDYAWPGNVRQLRCCVQSMAKRGGYRPPRARRGPTDDLVRALGEGTLTRDQATRVYTTLVYAQTGNGTETARRLGVDRHWVAENVDRELLGRLEREQQRPGAKRLARAG